MQGEGHHTGRAAAFVRFSGCNMQCAFCDTDHRHYRLMSADDIVQALQPFPARYVVLTGGEPSLQADQALIDLLHRHQYTVAIETNGTKPLPRGIDWVTVSPKPLPDGRYAPLALSRCNELKVLFLSPDYRPQTFGVVADYYFLQPCDTGDAQKNRAITDAAVEYIKQFPSWRLSLQTHKLAEFK